MSKADEQMPLEIWTDINGNATRTQFKGGVKYIRADECIQLREQNRVLREALQQAKYELAALFPVPSDPTVLAALKVCGNNNEADARCIYMAYEIVRAALTATSQRLTPNEATE